MGMNKTFCLLLFCIAIACKEKVNKTQGKPPSFYFLKSKGGLSKDSLQFYANEIQSIDTSEISDSLKAEYAFMTGRFYYKLKDYDNTVLHFDKATSYTKKITNSRQVLHFRALIDIYRRKKQDFLNASGVNEKLLNLIDSTDYKNLAFVYSNKFQINRALAKYNEALENNLITAKLYLKAKDTINYLIATLDNAATSSKLEKTNEANKELIKVIPYQHLMSNSMKYQFHATQAYVFNQKGQSEEAIDAYKKSLIYSKKKSSLLSSTELINTYLNLSNIYLKLNSLEITEKYLDSIFDIGLENIDFGDKKEVLKNALIVNYDLRRGIENVMPKMEVKSRRVGGSTYQVPIEVKRDRGFTLATRWIIGFARQKKGSSFEERLASELIDAFNNTGSVVKKCEDTHKMAESNKAFAHFRW